MGRDKVLIPRYGELKPKVQQWLREDLYLSYLLCADISMFTYEDLPEEIEPRYLEMWLHLFGSVGIGRKGDHYIVGYMPARVGNLDQYGDGTELEITTCNGDYMTGRIGDDCVVMYNNSARTPDIDLFIDTETLSSIDQSLLINTKLSRVAPIIAGDTSITQKAMEEMLKNIKDGQLYTVTSSGTFDGLSIAEDTLRTMEPTSPERAQYMQYLSEYWDDVQRRHFARRGLAAKTSTKHAQVNNDELHGLDCISWYYPVDMLQQRQKAIEEFNRITGNNVQVHFSEIWQNEYDVYISRSEVIMDEDQDTGNTGGSDGSDPGSDSNSAELTV